MHHSSMKEIQLRKIFTGILRSWDSEGHSTTDIHVIRIVGWVETYLWVDNVCWSKDDSCSEVLQCTDIANKCLTTIIRQLTLVVWRLFGMSQWRKVFNFDHPQERKYFLLIPYLSSSHRLPSTRISRPPDFSYAVYGTTWKRFECLPGLALPSPTPEPVGHIWSPAWDVSTSFSILFRYTKISCQLTC